jgi:hypothetical protein
MCMMSRTLFPSAVLNPVLLSSSLATISVVQGRRRLSCICGQTPESHTSSFFISMTSRMVMSSSVEASPSAAEADDLAPTGGQTSTTEGGGVGSPGPTLAPPPPATATPLLMTLSMSSSPSDSLPAQRVDGPPAPPPTCPQQQDDVTVIVVTRVQPT